jgi:hypothetical protein
MTRKYQEFERDGEALSPEELSAEHVRALPDREELSLVNANVAAPINLALAANVLSDGSVAVADARQYAPIVQGI